MWFLNVGEVQSQRPRKTFLMQTVGFMKAQGQDLWAKRAVDQGCEELLITYLGMRAG